MAAKGQARHHRHPKVLLVDPRGEGLEAVAAELRENGLKVVASTRYETALALYGAFQPDAAVIAVFAPDLAGCQMANRLRQLSRRTLPVFYLVDGGERGLVEHCLTLGHGVDAMCRPVDGRGLSLKIRAQVALARAVFRDARVRGEEGGHLVEDPLTGAYTRRFLLAMIGQDVRRRERYGGSFSVLAAHLVAMPQLRERHGRERADRLLRYSAMLLRESLRASDVVARLSDDAFGVLLPGSRSEDVPALRARLLNRFELARYQVDGVWLRAQLSIGCASFPDVVGRAAQIVELALAEARRASHTGSGTNGRSEGTGTRP